jgi:hypothetical protein
MGSEEAEFRKKCEYKCLATILVGDYIDSGLSYVRPPMKKRGAKMVIVAKT